MDVLLEVKDLKKYFKTPKGMLHAVDGVNLSVEKGKTLGVVGESGCGKSTLGRLIVHLLDLTGGQMIFDGDDITNIDRKNIKEYRKRMQMIFQDPFSSLNPRMSIYQIISEPFEIYKIFENETKLNRKVIELMELVGLSSRLSNTYPHELDGGRRQRVGIARALALNPEFIVCDEPVSALDVSIQAQILNLMQDLQEELNLTYMFITHDLSVIKHISDDVCVMYLGQIVEKTSSKRLFNKSYHPYTKALLSAIPVPVIADKEDRILLKGEVVSPINPKPGCRFAPRCLYSQERCLIESPELRVIESNHVVACHFAEKININN